MNRTPGVSEIWPKFKMVAITIGEIFNFVYFGQEIAHLVDRGENEHKMLNFGKNEFHFQNLQLK